MKWRRRTCARGLLLESFHAAIAAADPLRMVSLASTAGLPEVSGRTLVVGAGQSRRVNGAGGGNICFEARKKMRILEGIVLTRYGHGLPLKRIQVVEAGHPLPDEQGEQAARTILAEVQKLGAGRFSAVPAERRRLQPAVVAGRWCID